MILNESTTKVSLRYNHDLGDRITVSRRFLEDKANLSPQLKIKMRHILRRWERGGGKEPIFEPKRRIVYDGQKSMMYVVEIQKRVPPTHVVIITSKTDPLFNVPRGGKPNPQGTLYIFDRVFTDYDEYLDYINNVLKNA